MGEFGSEQNYPKLRGPSSKPLLGGANVGPDGADGADAVFVASQANNILVPSDFDGGNPVLTNAITEFEIWQGNTLLATKSSLDGWTSQVIATNGVSIDDSTDLEATVTVITQDEADFVMQFDKVGFTSVTAKIYVKKARQGEKGDTGDPGATGGVGPTGPVGPTGSDGTGLVIVKKVIDMTTATGFPSTASNSGGLLFTSPTAHQLVVGDTVLHASFSESTYNGYHKVVSVPLSTTYRIETVVYVSAVVGTGEHSSNMRPVAGSLPQDLMWLDMVPDGVGLLELRLYMITEDDQNELYAYLGYNQYPTTGWSTYLNGELFEQQGNQRTYPALVQPYLVPVAYVPPIVSNRGNVHLRLTPYSGKIWATMYPLVKFNLFATYINFNLDTIGS